MKYLVIVLMILFLASCVYSQDLVFGENPEITWDEVTGDGIHYEVFLAPFPYAGSEVSIGIVATPGFAFTISQGRWTVGVRTVKEFDELTSVSEITWAHISGIPSPWFLGWLEPPGKPQSLKSIF